MKNHDTIADGQIAGFVGLGPFCPYLNIRAEGIAVKREEC